MENGLAVYERTDDPRSPVVCFDERPCVLHGQPVEPLPPVAAQPARGKQPAKPDRTRRESSTYVRQGTACLMAVFEPGTGQRIVEVSVRRTGADYCRFLQRLGAAYPRAQKMVLVQDNGNAHTDAVFYRHLRAAEARALAARFELHYTPKDASWLNRIELELSTIAHQLHGHLRSRPGHRASASPGPALKHAAHLYQLLGMGCYAAMYALKLADAFCQADADARVLIVCAELCTLHFQKSPVVLVQVRPAAGGPSLIQEAFHYGLQPAGARDLAWYINDFGFEMTLSADVSGLIQRGIRQLTDELLAQLPVALADIQYFVIYPGERKILETIETELGLTHKDNRFAHGMLRDYGNMSSAAVLFVLRDMLRTLTPAQAGDAVLSFAFGPDLTLEAVLKVHCAPGITPVQEATGAKARHNVAAYV